MHNVPEPSNHEPQSVNGLRRWAAVCVGISVGALLALTVLQYVMPQTMESVLGLNYPGVRHFQHVLLGTSFPGISNRAFVLCFRFLLAVVWISYALAVLAGLQGGILKLKSTLTLVVLVSILLAFFWPASLSSDSYAYVAYARMKVLYGQNPYTFVPASLHALGDPSASFLVHNMPSSYSSVWTLLSVGVVSLLHSAGLWWQEVAMKLIEAAALVMAALAGRTIARHVSPGKENLALLAIGLNPLFLVEGPGNGHNDLLMMSLLLVGISLFLKKRYLLGSLLFGLSVGIKFVTIAIVPWIIIEYCRGRRMREKALLTLTVMSLAIAPAALCYVPFMRDASLFAGLHQRWAWGLSPSAAAQEAGVSHWLVQYGAPEPIARLGSIILTHWPLAAIIVGLSLWLWWRRAGGRWLAAWVILSGSMILLTAGVWFPWYFIWPFAVSLTRWDRLHFNLSAVCFIMALTQTMAYTVAPP